LKRRWECANTVDQPQKKKNAKKRQFERFQPLAAKEGRNGLRT
jgi:hypothetical protein